MPPKKVTGRATGHKRKKSTRVVARKFGANVQIRSSGVWHHGSVSAGRWVTIGRGYLYIAYKTGRAYWIFQNGARAKISFNDEKRTMKVNTFEIRFSRPVDYKYAKDNLAYWARFRR
jgi:hypothetical protein